MEYETKDIREVTIKKAILPKEKSLSAVQETIEKICDKMECYIQCEDCLFWAIMDIYEA